MTTLIDAPPGLEGVAVARTAVGEVRGDEGRFHYRGHDATELATYRTLEDVWHLVLLGALPDAAARSVFDARIATARAALDPERLAALATHLSGSSTVARVRTLWSDAAAALGCRPWADLTTEEREAQAIGLTAVGPAVVACAHDPAAAGRLAGAPDGLAAGLLALVGGAAPTARATAALERYLVLTIDHGLNASTFTARTVASTGADLGAVLVAALGALSGPLHGGAPSRALDMLDAIGTVERAPGWIDAALDRGERLMGFGHRIYRTEDPRARALRATAIALDGPRVPLARQVEAVARQALRERKPDRVLDVNVEYWAAVVLDAVGIPPALFTPTFAIARSIGWMAHALEQTGDNRIVRPTATYTGPSPSPPGAWSRADV